MAATSSLRDPQALSSLHHLHSSSPTTHGSNPNSNPSLSNNLGNEYIAAFTVYPSFPHFSHLGPVSLFEASNDRLIAAQSTSLTIAT
jgi:hypothetical protein